VLHLHQKPIFRFPCLFESRCFPNKRKGCGEEIALLLRIIKLTGARVGEIYNLKWKDIDFESKRLSIVAEKGSRPRLFNVPEKLIEAIKQQPNLNDRLFNSYKSLTNLRRTMKDKETEQLKS
jgi:integrase